MNLLIKRRQLVMATLVVALGAAVFVNWYFTNSDSQVAEEGEIGSEYVQSIGEAKYVNSNNAETEDTTNNATATASKNTDYFTTVKPYKGNYIINTPCLQQKILSHKDIVYFIM